MSRRLAPTVAQVAAALGQPSASVRDVEPPPMPGAWASLTHAFEVDPQGAERPRRMVVFPYDDPVWDVAVRAWLSDEVLAVRSWWTWVREGLGRDGAGVWRIPPLVEPVARGQHTPKR